MLARGLVLLLVAGAQALNFFRQDPGSSAPTGSAPPAPAGSEALVLPPSAVDAVARPETHMKVPEIDFNDGFDKQCEHFFTTTLVAYDGKASTIDAMLHGVCAHAKLADDAGLCDEIRASFKKQMAGPELFGQSEDEQKNLGHVAPDQEYNENKFDVKVFCEGVGQIIVAHKMSIGPKTPNGVINTPLDAKDVPAGGSGSGSGSAAASASTPAGGSA